MNLAIAFVDMINKTSFLIGFSASALIQTGTQFSLFFLSATKLTNHRNRLSTV